MLSPPLPAAMSPPLAVSLTLLLSFSTLAMAHVWLALGLLAAPERKWRGLLILVPLAAWLAPYWGYRSGFRRRTWLWACSLLAYTISHAVAASLN